MSTHTIDMTTIEPLPEAVAMQKAPEALEAAEVDLYPRDVQPTNVVRNRIQFAAFVVRGHLKQQTQAKPAAPELPASVQPGPWHLGGTFLPGTPDVHCTVWSTAPAGHASGDEIAKYVHPRDAHLIAAAPDLLDALRRMVESITGVDQVSAVNEARAAIAKATGCAA